MKKYYWYIAIALVLAIILMISKKGNIIAGLKNLLRKFEGFSSKAYWDISRYSWGYGTAAPSSGAVITESDAMNEAVNFSIGQQQTLKNYLTVKLNTNQWIALLDFAYNLGTGNAIKLIKHINAGNEEDIKNVWNEYIYADGIVNSDLVERRAYEYNLYTS